MPADVLLVYDDRMLGHNPMGWDPERPEWTESVKALLAEIYPDKDFDEYSHPERPQRLTAIIDRLHETPIAGTAWHGAAPAGVAELARVHTRQHVDFVESLAGQSCWLSVDTTAVSPDSVLAAKLAAGAGIAAVEAIVNGRARRAFCAVRPPGHHAPAGRAMGFCLYNNVAVAAAHARSLGLQRILILDWDLHHGNGTQDIFYADPDVLFIDSHCAAPFYPGTGQLDETGRGDGVGLTLNVPLPAGSGNDAMLAVLQHIVRPAAEQFRPELVLVSAGFDAHHRDQTFAMDEGGYGALATGICDVADAFSEGRLILCLEGGYNADAVASSAHAVVTALAGTRHDACDVLVDDPGLVAVDEAAGFHAARILQLPGHR